MTNSTPDLSHSEQIIFVFRFLHFNDNQLWEVKERFLKLEELEKKKGSDITKLILNVLEENELDIKNCRGQGYDNGANVAGIYNGVQALIRQNNPQAIFIPCSAHSLNLCAVYAIESSALAKSYFENIQNLYNLFSSSPVRWKILQEETGQSLHKLSVTRWSSRIESVKPLAKKPILKSLHRLKELDLPGESSNEVRYLIKWMNSFEFVVFIIFWFKCLMAVNNVSLLLQSTQLTLDDEVKILNSLLMDLDRIRLSWDLILIEATEVAKNLKFDKIMFTVKRTRKKIIPNETAGYNHKEALKNFECNVFNVALDNPTSQMRSRFKVIEEECCKFSFLWSLQKSQTDQELGLKAVNLAKLYPEDLCKNEFSDEVRHFFSVRRNILVSEKPVELLNEVYAKELHSIFPQVCVSLRILLTLPVSTSEGERSFSKLAIIKDYLRSTMGQERLCYLMILSIESDLAINVNY
ncbi:zinc finger MYM-type protein 1-like [Hydra vulgaris]|uniref:zinc finger MYM-type protein 1-like n=1 Tax=Hydra vulgaris TaxID=6087 RepID=UPI0032EA3E4E